MEKVILAKKEYLGDGYAHVFVNKKTGVQSMEFCTKEQYESLGEKNGYLLNPTKDENWEYVLSCGGFPILNTANKIGEEFDFFIKDEKYFVYEFDTKYKQLGVIEYSKEDFEKKYIWQ